MKSELILITCERVLIHLFLSPEPTVASLSRMSRLRRSAAGTRSKGKMADRASSKVMVTRSAGRSESLERTTSLERSVRAGALSISPPFAGTSALACRRRRHDSLTPVASYAHLIDIDSVMRRKRRRILEGTPFATSRAPGVPRDLTIVVATMVSLNVQ